MQDCTKPIHSSLRAPARVALCLPTPRFPACGALSCPSPRAGRAGRGAMGAAQRPLHCSHGCSRTRAPRSAPRPFCTLPHLRHDTPRHEALDGLAGRAPAKSTMHNTATAPQLTPLHIPSANPRSAPRPFSRPYAPSQPPSSPPPDSPHLPPNFADGLAGRGPRALRHAQHCEGSTAPRGARAGRRGGACGERRRG